MARNKSHKTIRKCGRCGGTISNDDKSAIRLEGKEFHSDCAVKDMQTRAKKIVLPKSVVESARDMMFDLGWFNLHKYKGKIKLNENLKRYYDLFQAKNEIK